MTCRDLGIRLMFVTMLRRGLLHRMSGSDGLHSGQLPLLEVLIGNAGSTQKELAERLRVTPASIALSTKRLQKSGYIEKRIDENNRRCNRLYATPAGEAAALQHRQYLDEANEKTFAGFSEADRAQFGALLDRAIENLNEDGLPLYPFHWKENNKC